MLQLRIKVLELVRQLRTRTFSRKYYPTRWFLRRRLFHWLLRHMIMLEDQEVRESCRAAKKTWN